MWLSRTSYRWCAGSWVLRAHAATAVDPGSNLAGGPVLHATPPISLPFLVYPLSQKSVILCLNKKRRCHSNRLTVCHPYGDEAKVTDARPQTLKRSAISNISSEALNQLWHQPSSPSLALFGSVHMAAHIQKLLHSPLPNQRLSNRSALRGELRILNTPFFGKCLNHHRQMQPCF